MFDGVPAQAAGAALAATQALHEAVAVRYRGERTHYVRRAGTVMGMRGPWCLPSVPFAPAEMPAPDVHRARAIFARMSRERFQAMPVQPLAHVASGLRESGPTTSLHLFVIRFLVEPDLDPAFYAEGAWLTPDEAAPRTAGQACAGLWAAYERLHPRPKRTGD